MKAPFLPHIEGPTIPSVDVALEVKEADLLSVEDYFFIQGELEAAGIDLERSKLFWSRGLVIQKLIHAFNALNSHRETILSRTPDSKDRVDSWVLKGKMQIMKLTLNQFGEFLRELAKSRKEAIAVLEPAEGEKSKS